MKKVNSFNELKLQKSKRYSINSDEFSSLDKFFNLSKEGVLKVQSELKKRSEFLSLINLLPVTRANGNKLIGALAPTISGRKSHRTFTMNPNNEQGYILKPIDSGKAINWDFFDAMASNYSAEELEEIHEAQTIDQIAHDMAQIGWHGASIAEETTAQDLSDVQKGWLTKLKEQNPTKYKTSGISGNIKIFGENADYKDLNELSQALRKMLDTHHQARTDLVFFVGLDLLAKHGDLLGSVNHKLGTKSMLTHFSGLPIYTPPNFPAKGAAVTTFKNLSIYTSTNSASYAMYTNNDSMNYITSFYRNEDYIVEDLGLMSAIDPNAVILGK
ncbi:P2 family phage major capsid protein [Histophilus somni]|uniref:P2 family phage major capsid protein n=1 Tax=Histophilus somni TaxID=731 RepID=UPI00201EE218|nr:P2 family phage major capsid protein [Histophilus somni]